MGGCRLQAFPDLFLESVSFSSVYPREGELNPGVAPIFRGLHVSALDNGFLDRFNLRLNKCGNKSMGRAVSVARHWVRFLRRYNQSLDRERVFAFKKDVPAPHEYSFYTMEQFRKFLSVIVSPRDRLLFGILFYYGLRISEALALKGSDFDNGWLSVSRIVSAKNGKGHQTFTSPKTTSSIRRLPPVPQVEALLKAYRHGRGFLFKSNRREDRVLGQSEAHRLNLRYARMAGLPAIKLHEFRHSCATCLLANGVSPRYVSRWLGHSSEETTLKYYSHLLPDEETKISDFWGSVDDGSSGKKM